MKSASSLQSRVYFLSLSLLLIFLASCYAPTGRVSDAPDTAIVQPDAWLPSWTCVGLFDNSRRQGMETDWFEEMGGEAALDPLLTHKLLETSPTLNIKSATPDQRGYVDLNNLFGYQENKVVYAWTLFYTNKAGFSFLKAGSDDGIAVWINGNEVHRHEVYRAAAVDQDIVPVKLEKGRNRCLVKITQGGGDWGYFLRFGDVVPQVAGVHLKVQEDIVPPVILLGSALPIDQTLTVALLNHGTDSAESFYVQCNSPYFKKIHSEPVTCGVGEMVEISFLLRPSSNLKLGKDVPIHLEAVLPDGATLPLTTVRTRVDLAHHLLRTKTLEEEEPFFVVQLTDPHLIRHDTELQGVKTAHNLERAISEINAMSPFPDFVIVTGDIVHDHMEGYTPYQEIMSRLKVPYLSVFGNHDKPIGLPEAAQVFSEWGLPPYYAFVYKGYWFVILDSVNEIHPMYGEISGRQVQWLDEIIHNETKNPRLFFLHHDLFSGVGVKDYETIQDALKKDTAEQWFFYGHWHADCFVKWGIQRHIVTTATGYLFGDNDFKHDRHLPGYRLIHFNDGSITTQFKPLGGEPLPDPPVDEYYTIDEILSILNK